MNSANHLGMMRHKIVVVTNQYICLIGDRFFIATDVIIEVLIYLPSVACGGVGTYGDLFRYRLPLSDVSRLNIQYEMFCATELTGHLFVPAAILKCWIF